jgi:sec-independent protein translocase protein TatA
MFNLGAPEMLLLGVLALILFGPRRLPELGKALGEGLSAFRESSRQLSHEFRRQLEDETSTPQPPPSIPAEVLLPPSAPVMPVAREEEPIQGEIVESETEPEASAPV